MARPLRIEFEGAHYHVMARGNAGADIFLNAQDRQVFVENLGRVCMRFHWRIWAWCLMRNHYHLLLETMEPTLSRGMREVNGVYTQAFNRRHGRTGHVLQGRFKAPLVDKDSYLMELSRYVVLNPVRAKLVESAGDWDWSSYLAIMGKAAVPDWLAVEETLALFHTKRGPARLAYARFVADGVGASDPSANCPRSGFVGNEIFVERMLDRLDVKTLSPEIARKDRPAPTLEAIAKTIPNRNEAIRRAYASTAYSLSEIAQYFGIHVSTASRIARDANAKHKT
ncbi:MAG: transposase [Gammaproteobacteria bacterium]|jgi:putative transposase|nr:transposase [Gammaproteobacteria bacterium]